MKALSKLITVVFTGAALFFAANVTAQTIPAKALVFGIGVDAGLPTGNLTIGHNFVLGGTANLQYGLSNSFAITLTSGADHFFSKIADPTTGQRFQSFGVIPIKAGIKYFFVPSIYLGVEAGLGIEEFDGGVSHTKFLASPAVGWANKHWDLSIRYDDLPGNDLHGQNDSYGFVAIRLGYGFSL